MGPWALGPPNKLARSNTPRNMPTLSLSIRAPAPMAPPDLIQSVSPVNLPFLLISLVNLLIIWNRVACKSIALFVTFFHTIISHDHRFFFEVPPFEELQDSDSSPRREEVGRRTLRDYGGFLLSFFYRTRFRLFARQFPVFVEKLQKLPLTSLQTPREWKNRTQLEKFYTFDVAIPLEDEFSTKSRTAIDYMQSVKISQLYD